MAGRPTQGVGVLVLLGTRIGTTRLGIPMYLEQDMVDDLFFLGETLPRGQASTTDYGKLVESWFKCYGR